MKSKTKLFFLLILLIIFSFSSIFNSRLSKYAITHNNYFEFNEKDQIQIKLSGFWELTGNLISIDDSDPSKNWSYTALHYDWCSGSGNWTDPYVIENVTINAQYSGSCIEIKNSDVYFIVRNCLLYNTGYSWDDAGIKLDNVDSGNIINNDCSNNYRGINLLNSNNNTLSGNIASNNNYYGIYFEWDCDNNTLSGNTASNNNYYGIYLEWNCDNNTLSGNTASNNRYAGMYLSGGSNNKLYGNLMNFCGIHLEGTLLKLASLSIDVTNLVNNKPVYYYVNETDLGPSNFTNAGQIILINCSNSIISELNFSECTTGIFLGYSNNNTLSGNSANNNGYAGIHLYNSDDNTLSGNTANNNDYGIYLERECNNNILSGNTANDNDYGISLGSECNNNTLSGNTANINFYAGISLGWESNNNTLSGNTASNNYYDGISLSGTSNNNLSGNLLNLCRISLSGQLPDMISHSIDDTNLVNNKPVYYYANEIGLKSINFTNSGQIILINCTNSIISELNISDGSGMCLYYCVNNTLSGNIANNNDYGLLLWRSDNNTLSGNKANNNEFGISLGGECNNNTLSGNTANDNDYGISLRMECNNNTLLGNIANNNYRGINLEWECDNNMISGNTANDNSYGIYLSQNNNNMLSGNIAYNNYIGISLRGSYNNTLLGNIANDNDYGISLDWECDNNLISGNTVNSSNRGIHLDYSNYNTLSGNIISNCRYRGIYVRYSNNNTLSGNLLNFCGISLIGSLVEMASHSIDVTNLVNNKPVYYYVSKTGLGSSNFINAGQIILINCNDSIISELNISDSTAGIFLGYSNTNTLSGNIISNNYYGIWLDSNSNNNKIYLNLFISNAINAMDDGVNNKWDNGTNGNYWDYFTGVDANYDGISDTPYLINGNADSQDNFPILLNDDYNAPVIRIIVPLPDSILGMDAPFYIISVEEVNLDTIWYTLDGGGTNYTIRGLTGTFNQAAWESLSEGNLIIRFYANDTWGNVGFMDVEVIIEISEDNLPLISFGNYYVLFTFIAILSIVILERQKKK